MADTYLYNEGVENVAWVEGYGYGYDWTHTKESDHLLIDIDEAEAAWVTDAVVDLSAYSTLKVDWESAGDSAWVHLIVSSVKNGDGETYNARYTDYGSFARKTDSVDVSALSGSYYVRVHLYGSGVSQLKTHKVWLESASEAYEGGSESTIEISAEGTGAKTGNSGSDSIVTVSAQGGGYKLSAQGGSESTVFVTPEGTGSKTVSGSSDIATFTRASTAYKLDGTSVAIDTPRYEDAAAGFGKAVMAEVGATTLIPSSYGLMTVDSNSDGVVDGFTKSYVNATPVFALDGGQRITLANVTVADGRGQVYTTTRLAVAPNTPYAISADCALTKSGAERITLMVWWYTAADAYISQVSSSEIDPGIAYSRQALLATSPATAAKADIYLRIFAKAIGATGVAHFRHAMFQPAYATSFHPTTRAAETLTTPKAGVLSDTEGSVQCRVKPLRSYGTNHQYVFDGGGAANHNLQVYIDSTTGKPTLVYGTGAAEVTITSSGAAVVSGTHYGIGWKWGTAGVTLLVNGAPVGTDATAPSLTLGDTMYLGSKADGTLQLDGLLDDDRVSSIARTDEEFLADYASGVPLTVDQWTTLLMDFDDSLVSTPYLAMVTVSAEGAGGPYAQGGSESSVSIAAEGLGAKATSGGAEATVAVSAEGAGAKQAQGGTEATVAVAPEGGGCRSTVRIAGIDRPTYILNRSPDITSTLNARDVCRFSTFDRLGVYRPAIGEEVIVVADSVRLFAGTINTITERVEPGTTLLVCACECVDYNQLCDRHLVARIYEDQTLKEIVEDIVAQDLAGEGITTVNVQTGLTITKAVFNYRTVTEAFNELADLAGYSWSIDYYKDLHFFGRETNYAPVAITGANARNFSVRSTRDQYRNRQYVRAGYALTSARTESFVGDGTRKSFNLAFPCGKVPSAVTVDAVAKTIGIRVVEKGKDFYWSKGDTEISQDDGAEALGAAEILAVTYQGQYPLLVDNRNSPEIAARAAVEGGSGLYEAVQDEPDYDDDSLAIDKGNALLRKYGRISKTITFETDEDGLQAGQLVDITLGGLALSGSYLISQVSIRDATGLGDLRYRVTALDGEDLGGWLAFYRKLAAAGQKFVIRENEVLLMLRYAEDEVECGDSLTVSITEIPLLYNEGLYEDKWVEGWSGGAGSQSKESDHLYLYAGGESGVHERTWVTDELVNLTGIAAVKIDWQGLGCVVDTECALVASTEKIQDYECWDAQLSRSDGTWARTIQTLDVSALSGLYYIRIHAFIDTGTGEAAELKVFAVWLE